jgi:hypothetical protein
VQKRLGAASHQETYGQRPQTFLVMNTRLALWKKFLLQRTPTSRKPD